MKKFIAYKRGAIIKNSFGENVSLIDSRTVVWAKTYKEAKEKAINLGFSWVCHPFLD